MADSELPKPPPPEKKTISRRALLKSALIAGAGLVLSGVSAPAQAAQETPEPKPKDIEISVKGLAFPDQESRAEFAARITAALTPLQTMIPAGYPPLSVRLQKGPKVSSYGGLSLGKEATDGIAAEPAEAFVMVFCPEDAVKPNLENIEAAAFNHSTKLVDSTLQAGLSNAMALRFHSAFGLSPENYFEENPHAAHLFKFSTYSNDQRVHIGEDMETRQDYLANGLTLLKYKPQQVLQELSNPFTDNDTKEKVASLFYLSVDVFSKMKPEITTDKFRIDSKSMNTLKNYVKPSIVKTR